MVHPIADESDALGINSPNAARSTHMDNEEHGCRGETPLDAQQPLVGLQKSYRPIEAPNPPVESTTLGPHLIGLPKHPPPGP